jgi:hypothetical protein
MTTTNWKLTTVKILKDNYQHFQVAKVNTGITLQRLVNRSIYLYLNNEEYKKQIDSTKDLQPSGSAY